MSNTTSPDHANNASAGVAENPKWTADEIDRYLLLLAQEAASAVGEHWDEFCAAARRQGAVSRELATAWEQILASGPERVAQVLVNPDPGVNPLRRQAPLHVLVPRERREQILRDAALSGGCGSVYSKRWEGDPADGNFVDALVEHLLLNMNGELREKFTEFVTASAKVRWIIAADFVIGDDTRPNDVFAFTVFPDYDTFKGMAGEIASVFPKDLKKTQVISPEMTAYLRAPRRFHFAFVADKKRRLFEDVDAARAAIDATIQLMLKYGDVERHRESIDKIRALRQEANANAFNKKLFQDIILMAAFGAFIAMLLQLEGRGEVVGFFPDRDKMTTTYGTLGYETFAQNASAFALRRKVPEAQIILGLPGDRDDGKSGIYYDEFIRIPDFVGGAVAGTDFAGPQPSSVNQKCIDIVAKALIDNPYAALFRMDLPPKALATPRIVVQSTPAPSAQAASPADKETEKSSKASVDGNEGVGGKEG